METNLNIVDEELVQLLEMLQPAGGTGSSDSNVGDIVSQEVKENQVVVIPDTGSPESESKVSNDEMESLNSLQQVCDILNQFLVKILKVDSIGDPVYDTLLETLEKLSQELPGNHHKNCRLSITQSQIFSDCCFHILLYLKRLSESTERSSVFQMLILTLDKLWNFITVTNQAEELSVSRNVLQALNDSNTLFTIVAEPSPKFLMLLRLLFQMIQENETKEANTLRSQFLTWFDSEVLKTSCTPTKTLTLYIQHASADNQGLIVSHFPNIITQIRNSLISSNSMERKQGVFILKSITSSFAGNKPMFDTHHQSNAEGSKELMLDLAYNLYLKFWSDYFELLEILDEKQVHIIEPFLHKLDKLESYSSSPKFINWYFVLLKKMIGHENRSICEKGILDFFKARKLMCSSTKELFFEFINTSIFPIVKENVGWVFPEAKNFFSAANELGVLLHEKYVTEILASVELVGGFIEGYGSRMSPLSLLFLLECLRSRLNLTSPKQIILVEPHFEKCVFLFSKLLSKCLLTVDKFIGCQIQKTVVDIFCKLSSLRREDSKGFGSIALSLREFLGVLDRETIVNHVEKLSHALSPEFSSHVDVEKQQVELTKKQKLGHFRMLFIIYSANTSMEPCVTLKTFPFHALLPIESVVRNSSVELIKCILLCGNSKEDLWVRLMRNSMKECLSYWISRFQNDTLDEKLESNEVLEIQEELIKCSYNYDPELELDFLNKHIFEILHEWTLGRNIYEDCETLRLFFINTVFRNKYSNTPFCAIDNLEDTFFKTELSNYGKLVPKPEKSFLSEFYEVRMKALTVILDYLTLVKSTSKLNLTILDLIIDQVDISGPTGIICAMDWILRALSLWPDDLRDR